MKKVIRNIIAICFAILPICTIMIWYRLTQTESFTSKDMTVNPLLFDGSSIVLILKQSNKGIKQLSNRIRSCSKIKIYTHYGLL
jgi:hypothetical protein